MHFIEPLLLLLLSLEGFEHLKASQLIVTLDRLNKDKSPLLEFFLRFERDFQCGVIRGYDLNEVLSVVASSPAN